MTPEELNVAKFSLDQRRFRFDRAKTKREQAFAFRHSAVLITSALSLATVVVSVTSAVNSIQATKQNFDFQQAETARKAKLEEEATKREGSETERKVSFELLQYITANYDVIYSQKTQKQLRIRNAMKPAFPESALKQIFARLAESAPTVDGPNVWQEDQRKQDSTDLGPNAPSLVGGPTTVALPTTQEEVTVGLTGRTRRLVAQRLAEAGSPVEVELITSALLPQTDRWSYRFNLYAAVALAKFKDGWPASPAQFAAIAALTKTGNYADATFKSWVDAALKNSRRAGA